MKSKTSSKLSPKSVEPALEALRNHYQDQAAEYEQLATSARSQLDHVEALLANNAVTPMQPRPIQSPKESLEGEWLDRDLSRLEEYGPYDWAGVDPMTLGKPVQYIPNIGFVVEGSKSSV
jgi:hypothetical protein